jgi:hypothetical protein
MIINLIGRLISEYGALIKKTELISYLPAARPMKLLTKRFVADCRNMLGNQFRDGYNVLTADIEKFQRRFSFFKSEFASAKGALAQKAIDRAYNSTMLEYKKVGMK